jgi:predicted aminopeptidase
MDWSTLNETLSQAAEKAQQDDEVSLRSFVISIGTAAVVLIVAAAGFLLLHITTICFNDYSSVMKDKAPFTRSEEGKPGKYT